MRNAGTIICNLEMEEEEREMMLNIVGNKYLSGYYRQLAKDLDVVEVKGPH